MLSAIVLMPSQIVRVSARPVAEALARTLSALVPAAVEGVLRDVTIASITGLDGVARIADHAGCDLVEALQPHEALRKALSSAREANVFVILAGRAPESGFVEELAEFLGDGHNRARMRERSDSLLTRLAPGLAPAAAILASRTELLSIADGEMARMSRRLGSAPSLRCRARRVD